MYIITPKMANWNPIFIKTVWAPMTAVGFLHFFVRVQPDWLAY